MPVSIMNVCSLFLGSFVLMVRTMSDTSFKLPKICRSDFPAKCEMNRSAARLTCTSGSVPRGINHSNAKIVYFCSWPETQLDPASILNEFPQLVKLTITKGNVTNFLNDFPPSDYLRQLVLTNLSITYIRPSLLMHLENLEFLDLSHNLLSQAPVEMLKNRSSLTKIILTGNPWNCSADFEWILNKTIGSKIPNKNALRCGEGEYSGKPVYTVASFIKKMKKDCPRNICSCVMNNIVWNTQQSHLIPVITVNCSDRGLEELPAKLPVNTTTLLLSRNNISDLLPLSRNEIYSGIADIYLDYNQVKSVDVLEGASWLKRFRVFSLRGNNLAQLPVYALDNAFEKNTNMAKIYLGLNPWKCDCSFTPDFRHFLIKYRSLVKDRKDVTCSQVENDENSNMEITLLSMNSLCRKASHDLNPLDILSAVFASLILIILGKLLFDWWSFRRTGKLPWIAAKMPW